MPAATVNMFGVNTNILRTFYYSFIESVITFSITCWFHSTSLQNRTRLQSTVKVCSKIIGLPVRSLSTMCEQQTLRTVQDPTGPLTRSVPSVWVAPLRTPAPLPGLQDTEEENNLCSQSCSTPQLPTIPAPLPPYSGPLPPFPTLPTDIIYTLDSISPLYIIF